MNHCQLGMSLEQCRSQVGRDPDRSFPCKDGGKLLFWHPYGYEFSPDGVLRKLSCERSGVLRYGGESLRIAATKDRMRNLLGEPDQVLVYSLVEPGDVEMCYYFQLGLVARVYAGAGQARVREFTLTRLKGPKPGGRRLVRPHDELPEDI